MKTPIAALLLMSLAFAQAAAQDTISQSDSKWNGLFALGTKNIWRGIDFGNATPTAQGLVTFKPSESFDINVLGITSLTGDNRGYATTLNVFVNYTLKDLTLTLDNYYFHGDETNMPTNFWDYKNTHFLEARAAYAFNKLKLTAGYTLFGGGFYSNPVIDTLGNTLQNTRGLYLEAQYQCSETISLTIGGITAPSALNFTDKAGITNIGFKYTKVLKITEHFSLPLDFQLVVNPSYQNIAPLDLPRVGYGSQRVNFAVMLSLD